MATKPTCKYGAKCYRKNPQHLRDYSHDSDSTKVEKASNISPEHETPPKKKSRMEKQSSNTSSNSDEVTTIDASTSGDLSPADDVIDEHTTDAGTSTSSDVADPSQDIKNKFLVEMPDDFYEFWKFVNSIDSKKPRDALMSLLGLQLVGPYDILAGVKSQRQRPNYLLHWRYFYDPPELLTVLRGDDSSQLHFGYFRDDPQQMPAFVASNAAKDNCTITPRGENIFAAVNWYIEDSLKRDSGSWSALVSLQSDLRSWAERSDLSLDQRTPRMKQREKLVVCRTLHGAGMVVPLDDNQVGYRPVPYTPVELRKLFRQLCSDSTSDRSAAEDSLSELVTLIQFANDECDYGEGLELGLDLFSAGSVELHGTARSLLCQAYTLLGRPEYAKVTEAHLQNRNHTAQLSQLS